MLLHQQIAEARQAAADALWGEQGDQPTRRYGRRTTSNLDASPEVLAVLAALEAGRAARAKEKAHPTQRRSGDGLVHYGRLA